MDLVKDLRVTNARMRGMLTEQLQKEHDVAAGAAERWLRVGYRLGLSHAIQQMLEACNSNQRAECCELLDNLYAELERLRAASEEE